jgi:hypothetical protein
LLLWFVSALRKATVGAQDLTVDPSAVRAGKERHHVGNVFRLAKAFERSLFAQLFNLRICLTSEEQLRRYWARGYGVYCDIATPQLIGKHVDQPLNACLGSDIRTITRECLGDYAT